MPNLENSQSIARIPPKLFDSILKCLSPVDDRQTLVSLCQVSKSMLSSALPTLYSDISDMELTEIALAPGLCNSLLRSTTGKMVRKAAVIVKLQTAAILELEDEEDEDRCDQIGLRQVQTQWSQSLSCLRLFTGLEDLDIATEHDQFIGEMDLIDDTISRLPSIKHLLPMPFLNTLRHLTLRSLGYTDVITPDSRPEYTAYGSCWQLILASRNLHTLTLVNVDPASVFDPLLEYLSLQPNQEIHLCRLRYVEHIPRLTELDELDGIPLWMHDCVEMLPKLPFIKRFEYEGTGLFIGSTGFAQETKATKITHFANIVTSNAELEWLDDEGDWLYDLSLYLPAVQHLQTCVSLDTVLPNKDTFSNLTHLTLLYTDDKTPTASYIESFLSAELSPTLQYVEFSVRGLTQEDVQEWFSRLSSSVKSWSTANEVETVVLECDGRRMVWISRDGAFELKGIYVEA